jgi:uncharacterized membrane protein (Fun14 family)
MANFYPQNLTIFVGVNNTVRWYNSNQFDVIEVSASDGSFSTGTIRSSNLSRPITFNTPGFYSYHGTQPSPNGPMTFAGGTIRVVGAIVITTTKVYIVTTTATSTTSSVSTLTRSIRSTVTETTLVGGSTGALGAEELAVVAAAVALVVGFVIGLRVRR